MQLTTLGDLWTRNARLFPRTEAVVYGTTRRSYSEILDRGHRLASGLQQLGAARQDRISLLARNRAEWFDYFAACELHGYIAATLNFRLAAEELVYVLNDSGAGILLFEAEYTGIVDQIRQRLRGVRQYVCLGDTPSWAIPYESLLDRGDPSGPPFVASGTDAVRLIYTSGTTGKPKGVIRGQAADLALARICACTTEMPDGCRELIMMPMFHIGGQSMASGAHWAGGTVVLQRDFSPADILQAIECEKIDILHVTPTIIQAILDHPDVSRRDVSSLKTILYAAAPMPVALLRRGLEKLGKVFANCYGSTEVGAAIVLQKRFHFVTGTTQETARLASLGQEHHDSRVCIIDDDGNECPAGMTGEIALKSDAMMSGYWNRPEATAAAYHCGWLRTGDLGRMDEQGFVYLVDRKADMIISGGENIYSREVENALGLHPDVAQVAVIGVKDDYWGEIVKAIVVPRDGSNPTPADLIAFAGSQIARYKLPKTIELTHQLPLLPSAKVDKVLLRRQYAQAPSPQSETKTP
jgi:acyl-CoA synthetase (AMP-forming)/AMP-acid ligase II